MRSAVARKLARVRSAASGAKGAPAERGFSFDGERRRP